MIDIIRATIAKFDMIAEGQHVGVAVSGGADSVCLLHVLHALGIRVTVLHLNHGLRAGESDADEEFVARLARSLDVPCIAHRAEVRGLDSNLEQAGRKARYEFFERARQQYRLERIATGHTASDQAETVLYRLARGSGTAGLAGIAPVKDGYIIRPLIEIERSAVEDWLRGRGLEWRTDSSNLSRYFARNRIRHEVLPVLEKELNPAITETLARTARVAMDEEAYWSEIVRGQFDELFEWDGTGWVAEAKRLDSTPRALTRRLIREAANRVRGDLRGLDVAHVERLLGLTAPENTSARVLVPGIDAFRSFERIRIGPVQEGSREDRNYAFEAKAPGDYRIPGQTRRIILEKRNIPAGSRPEYTGGSVSIDFDKIHDRLVVRNWYPGDHFARMGHSDARLKEMFQQARIPIWERHGWPIVTSGEKIIWTRKFGPAAEFVTGPETTTVLTITEARENVKEA